MKSQILVSNLEDSDPEVRLESIRVLGLVEETLALASIRDAFRAETETIIKEALEWAGKRIHAAQRRGVTTFDVIFQEFLLYLPTRDTDALAKEKFLRDMNDDFQKDMADMQTRTARKRAMTGAALGMLAGGDMGAAGLVAGALLGSSLASAIPTNLRLSDSQTSGEYRIAPRMPSDMNTKIWIRRMKEDADPAKRSAAARELVELNNPTVLPQLAEAYLEESDESVQTAIEKTAKLLYVNEVYWEMDQMGILEDAIEKKLIAIQEQNQLPDSTG